jgi:hypothetical protein
MPQHHPRTESHRAENFRGEGARSERSRSGKPALAEAMNGPFGEQATASVNAGLHMQKQIFEVFEGIGREWFARATSKAELAFKLPHRLSATNSVPEAVSVYQEWLGEWINMFGEDSRRFMSDSQRIMDAGVRCFADASPLGSS